jgi:hypothetical protein
MFLLSQSQFDPFLIHDLSPGLYVEQELLIVPKPSWFLVGFVLLDI